MKAIIQRVSEASVTINGEIKGTIRKGFLVLLGVGKEDSQEDVVWLAKKILSLRIFSDSDGKMNLDIQEVKGDILLISQFTLHAKTKKGNRPSYIHAAPPEVAIPLYEAFRKELEIQLGRVVETGVFGADMDVALINQGPVTISMDTKNKE